MQTIKLLSRRKAAPTLFVLEFERPVDYSFRAGQFARLGMELESPHSNPDSPFCWTAPLKAA